MRQYNDTWRQLAQEHRDKGWSYKRISRELGVGESTVYRWLNPEYAERHRAVSRQLKQRYRGTCIDCGNPTSYAGIGDKISAERCQPCRSAWQATDAGRALYTKWTRELILDRIREWAALHDGKPPSVSDWNAYQARYVLHDEDRAREFLLADGHWPWFTHVVKRFGNWNAAIEAAGYTPNAPNGSALRWGGTKIRAGAKVRRVAQQ